MRLPTAPVIAATALGLVCPGTTAQENGSRTVCGPIRFEETTEDQLVASAHHKSESCEAYLDELSETTISIFGSAPAP